MGLGLALNSALSGLRTTQSGLSLVSANVANADTPGYTRKNQQLQAVLTGGTTSGVKQTAVTRAVDNYLQRQLRTESAGLAYAEVSAGYLDRLQRLFGTPGSATSLDSLINGLTGSLDALATSPDLAAAQTDVLNDAQLLAQSISAIANDVQEMRGEADRALQSGVDGVNQLLNQLANLSGKIMSGKASPDLLDQRDMVLQQLGEYVDIHVIENGNDLSVFTTGGIPLYSNGIASSLAFDRQSPVTAQAQYSTNPAERTIGTIMVVSPAGSTTDLLAGGLKSGSLKAYAELRDETLVQAQAQLDELASQLATALGTTQVSGTPATSGAQSGFDLDLSGLQPGDHFTLSYTQTPPGTQHTVSFFRVDDPASLPLDNAMTADPNDRVVGIDFSGASGSIAAQVAAALGGAFGVTGAGTSLQVLDDGAAGMIDITAMDARVTATGTSGEGALAFFVDAGTGYGAYSGNLDGLGQKTGFAQRIRVNPALISNPRALVASGTNQTATRATFLRDALESTATRFDPATGIGGANSPFKGSIISFANQMISSQAQKSEFAGRVLEGQQIVVTSLEDRVSEVSGVDVDAEMAKLLQLQSAYAANARVISTVKEMLDMLMRM